MVVIQTSVTLLVSGVGVEAVKIGEHIHHKMCEYDGEHGVKVWVLDHKGEKTRAYYLVDGYEPGRNTVYQFHRCHWHGHTCIKSCKIKQKMRYKDT